MKRENLNKEEYGDLLEDLCCEYCEPKRYCILKEFLISLHPSPRMLIQLECMDKFKLEQSKKDDHDIGWSETIKRWIDSGHAVRFAEIYDDPNFDENTNLRNLYRMIMKSNRSSKN